ncbi:peptidylprolyl isomerase [Jeongeupia naejangsanensis]|uniref:peptidylprolyl isomerase n=1 Tax=Jeongeupia naejangsanensis TaxID=613195 RepID=A0ABS2BN36_9NEIS|nr:peptidylprolyl isomerase [Jeongeupia naejangsanensis]MBM3116840.1 peptidyl-prolyl cis-trans isomerase [Jeongeupia naejangsanensis]
MTHSEDGSGIRVNGVVVNDDGMANAESAAVYELLRQQVLDRQLLPNDADDDAMAAAIEELLLREVAVPQVDEQACRRYFDAHAADYVVGERVGVRHILFGVTPAVPVPALLEQAQRVLQAVLAAPERIGELARQYSNCPSGAEGGHLGLLERGDTVPEFEQSLFGGPTIGVLPQLVRTRYGFHVVVIEAREAGRTLDYAQVQHQVAQQLQASALKRALSQYVQVLAGQADLAGVTLEQAETPLLR